MLITVTKRFVTLIEMMVVIALIAMILGVVAWNYRGSLEEGKAFVTEQSMTKLHQVIELHLAHHPEDLDRMEQEWQRIVSRSPLINDPKSITKDGWGKAFTVRVEEDTDEGEAKILIISESLQRYRSKK